MLLYVNGFLDNLPSMSDQHRWSELIKKFNYYILFAQSHVYLQKVSKLNCTLDNFILKITYQLKIEKLQSRFLF